MLLILLMWLMYLMSNISHISHISHIRNSYYRKRLIDELEVVEVEQRAVTADEVVAVE